MEADRKRRERNENRRTRILQKAYSVAGRASSSFDQEAIRELEKIQDYETTIECKPISKGNLKFIPPNRFEFDEFSDNKGIIKYSFQLEFSNEDVQALPESVDFEKRTFRICGVSFSRYGTFIAFEINYNKKVPGSKTTKIFNKSNPECSLIGIKAGDQLFFPLESTLDGQIVDGVKRYGVVAFEPFDDPVDEFEVVFIPKDEADEEPKVVLVSGPRIRLRIENENAKKSLHETFAEKLEVTRLEFNSHVSGEVQKIQKTVAKQRELAESSSCVLILALLGSTMCNLAMFVFFVGTWLYQS